jgi:hypothetical protein
MRNAFVVAAALILTLIARTRASAWRFDAHKYIMRRAIELKPFDDRSRGETVVRVIDPDLWRRVG